jgi:hypothetical protein
MNLDSTLLTAQKFQISFVIFGIINKGVESLK